MRSRGSGPKVTTGDREAPVYRSMVAILRGAPRPVWILVGGVLVNRMGSYFATFATLFLTSRDFSLASLPAILVAIAASGMLGSLAGGWLADRVSRRSALTTSASCSAASLTLVALAPTQPTVVVAVCLAAFCTQSYLPAAAALLVDLSPPEDRVPLFALFRLALNLGAAIGVLVAGILATHSYEALFLLDAGTSAAFAVVLLVGLPRVARGASAEDGETGQTQPRSRPARLAVRRSRWPWSPSSVSP